MDPEAFANAILEDDGKYDVIIIDAAPSVRSRCGGPALSRLKRGGAIILDDAPYYPEVTSHLQAAGLIRVDMTGFAALESELQTTSFFFTREYDPQTYQADPTERRC